MNLCKHRDRIKFPNNLKIELDRTIELAKDSAKNKVKVNKIFSKLFLT